MRRLHLFEWEDQPWLPRPVRDIITEQLQYTHREPMRRPVNAAIAARLQGLLARTGATRIVDLCAGGGGPLLEVHPLLAADERIEVCLTDRFPNVAAFRAIVDRSGGRIQASETPVDATDVPGHLHGVRTLFTAFHHFRPDTARAILADAVQKRAPIAIFEPLERRAGMLVMLFAVSLVRGFTHTHRLGRMNGGRFFWTYVVPLAPVAFAWDGLVSALRTYTPRELAGLAAEAGTSRFAWEAGRFYTDGPYGRMPTTYLVGYPSDGGHVTVEDEAENRAGLLGRGRSWVEGAGIPLAERKVALSATFRRVSLWATRQKSRKSA